jgi:hypothetical protein
MQVGAGLYILSVWKFTPEIVGSSNNLFITIVQFDTSIGWFQKVDLNVLKLQELVSQSSLN